MLGTIVLLLSCILRCLHGFPNGPPRSTCTNGLPMHSASGRLIEPQNGTCPYIITINATSYKPGDTISIRIHSLKGVSFKGIFLQMRPLPRTDGKGYIDQPMGTYYRSVENVKLINCGPSLDTITHKDAFSKLEAKFEWRAPLLAKNDVEIRATILKDFATYWTDVKSKRIRLVHDANTVLPVEKLEKPWVKEIIRTIKARDDVNTRRQLVKARFEKGFKNSVDPHGYIMVSYVNDMLPYEDKFQHRTLPATERNASESKTNETFVRSISTDANEFDASSAQGAVGVDVPVGVRVVHGNASLSEYDTCLRSVLKGDNSVLYRLSELVDLKT
ncbi:hypothetical protein DPMN_116995 [Dreissena polymorpha]|uniref:Reelin domain-containing protein n=2 Tax=Dreissena polymorpha TaxID=45954 RepID=A0A9D4KP70_DREPO|nr:hypothetical protein DPMN_116987 [Dreissena polymorpha]KAH3843472.1 hypothetical protein DPMN_116990 [Dreissena polymorpha]KAH3843477.1 hypothetical protein DPMN_116995 [Dreissena polymorpha]